jgi:Cu(I)/Ag(I) efflux system membrane fusion protein
VSQGATATLEFAASGRAPFEGRVSFLYPTLTERTRTLRVRFETDNLDGKLRPGLYGSAVFAQAPHQALVVPRDAVVDTGESQHVFVVEHARYFVPRKVTLGTRLQDRIEVLSGLSAGEEIVASGVFLIDSESRLRASGGAGNGHVHGAKPAAQPSPSKPANRAPAQTERAVPATSEHSGHAGH